MRADTLSTLALVLVVLGAATLPAVAVQAGDIGPAGSAPAADGTTTGTSPGANQASQAPGAKLSGSVGATQAELSGTVNARALDHALANADSNATRARVLNRTADRIRERLDALESRLATLRAAHQNGSMADSTYRARVAAVAAQINATRRLADRATVAAAGVPVDVRQRVGLNVSAVQTLSERASGLVGPDVAAIARSIAGRNAGAFVGSASAHGPNGHGPTTNASAAVTQANASVEHAATLLDRVTANVTVSQGRLAAVQRSIEDARSTLDDARAALSAGDEDRAFRLAARAEAQADQAVRALQTIQTTSTGQSGGGGPPNGTGSDQSGDHGH